MGVLSQQDNKVVIAAAVGAATVALGAVILTQKWRNRNKMPTEWEAVGKVTELFCFPIKSCGVVRVQEIKCGQLGFENQLFRDRVFMVLKPSGQPVTARSFPKMLKIHPKIEGNLMHLTAPDMPDITVNIDDVTNKNAKNNIELWETMVDYLDCGDEVAAWFSTYLLNEPEGIRLGYYAHQGPTRPAAALKRNQMWPEMTDEHAGAMHDESSYMMLNEANLEDLNGRLENKKVTPLWFRPNIVFNGSLAPFAEDKIKWFRIGEGTVFKNLKPCLRCTFTTIDPETAEKDPKVEPLKTLRKYRLLPGCEMSPGFGTHLGVVESDKIKVGDTVYIPKKRGFF